MHGYRRTVPVLIVAAVAAMPHVHANEPRGRQGSATAESLVLHQNKLFVSNEGSGEIKMFDRRTGRAIGPGAGFGAQVFSGKAEGLAVTGDYLFAVDVQNTRIAVFDLTGENPKYLLGFVGDFQSADGIAIDPTGKYVAIADQGNLRVLLYSLPEMLRHLAGLKR